MCAFRGDVHIYPDFGALGWLRQDYAVVTLDEPVYDRALGVVPQPLGGLSRAPAAGDPLRIAGYGLSNTDCSGPSLGLVSGVVASEVIPDAIRFAAPGTMACPGDSGGPAMDLDKFVLGVASWRNGGSSTYRPAYEVEDWVRGVIEPLETDFESARFTVSRGSSTDLDHYGSPSPYRPAVGIVGQAVSPQDGYVYTWYRNGTYSRGRSWDLSENLRQSGFNVPGGYWPRDIVGMAFASTNRVYTWYRNGRVSVGTPSDLDALRNPYAYSQEPGRSAQDIVGIDISSSDYVYTWYRDGRRFIGRSWDLAAFGSEAYSVPPGKNPDDIVEIGIAQDPNGNDRVYTWYHVAAPTSCAGACGGHSSDNCWCDAACETHSDCCSDYQAVCE